VLTIGGVDFPLATSVTTPVTVNVGSSTLDITYDSATGLFAIVNNDASQPISETDLDTLVRGVTYSNSLLEPTAADRTVAFTLTDSQGNVSLPAVATISINITDTDGDGASDAVEFGQDLNGDGIDDSIQSDVATLTNPANNSYVTIQVTSAEGCNSITNADHVLEGELAPQDALNDYFIGLRTRRFSGCDRLLGSGL